MNAGPENIFFFKLVYSRCKYAVLWIRIRMDPELLPGSGSVIIVPDPDSAKERADK